MKRLIPFILTLAVAACIPVDDLGNYWDKGMVDQSLVGVWQPEVGFKKDGDAKPFVIAKSDDKYRLDSMDDKELSDPGYKPTYAKTLQVGRYLFFMVGPRQGDLIRYHISGDKLEVYVLNARPVGELLKQKFPQVTNIEVHPENDRSYEDVRIKLLDDDVFGVLSSIPDTKEFWKLDNRYTRTAK